MKSKHKLDEGIRRTGTETAEHATCGELRLSLYLSSPSVCAGLEPADVEREENFSTNRTRLFVYR